jgi:glutamate synthase (ferredoxin)
MTGGRVVVLGHTGRNFAAGMSGGVAYVLDPAGTFDRHCNLDMVGLESLEDPEESGIVRALIERHVALTGSTVGAGVIEEWLRTVRLFVKVMPRDYKRVLLTQAKAAAAGRVPTYEELTGVAVNG